MNSLVAPVRASSSARRAHLLSLPLLALPLLAGLGTAPAHAEPSLDKVSVKVNGKALALKGAAVYHQGGSARTLEISTEPLPCSVYADFGRSLADGEQYFSVAFKPLLQADGTLKWTTESVEMSQQRPGSDTDLSALKLLDTDASKPVRFSFDLATVLPANDFFNKPEVKLALKGSGVADGCGLRKGTSEAVARPQKGLKLTVAGRSFEIQGATLTDEDGELALSTSGMDCAGGLGQDVFLKIDVKSDGENHAVYARGDVLEMQYNRAVKSLKAAPGKDEQGLFVKVLPAKAKDGPRTVQIAAHFEIGDFPAELSGEVEALDCTNAR